MLFQESRFYYTVHTVVLRFTILKLDFLSKGM